eukprot:349849-Chlamydomonas_euryale.AAC.5
MHSTPQDSHTLKRQRLPNPLTFITRENSSALALLPSVDVGTAAATATAPRMCLRGAASVRAPSGIPRPALTLRAVAACRTIIISMGENARSEGASARCGEHTGPMPPHSSALTVAVLEAWDERTG